MRIIKRQQYQKLSNDLSEIDSLYKLANFYSLIKQQIIEIRNSK